MDAIEDHHHRECLYIKSALETMPEVLEALSTALCRATLWQVVGGTGQAGRANLLMSGLGPAITPVIRRYAWPAKMKLDPISGWLLRGDMHPSPRHAAPPHLLSWATVFIPPLYNILLFCTFYLFVYSVNALICAPYNVCDGRSAGFVARFPQPIGRLCTRP